MDVGLQLVVERDNNVSRSNAAVAARQGIVQDDVIVTPSLTVDIRQPLGRQSVFLKGAIGYSFYDKNERLDRERANLQGGVELGAGPCMVKATADYLRGQSELRDMGLTNTVEKVLETRRIGAEAVCATSGGLGLVAGASQTWGENSAAQVVDADSEKRGYRVGVTYARPTLGALTLFGSREEVDYPNRRLVGGRADGYELEAIGVTYSRKLGARIEGEITAAHTTVEPAAPLSPGTTTGTDFEGATYSALLAYRASSRLRFQAEFSRAVSPTLAVGRQYEVQTGYRVSGDYDIGSRFRFSLGVAQNESEADGTSSALANVLTNSTTKAVYGALRYQQSRRLGFTLNARHEERDANASEFDFSAESVGVTANVTF